MTEIVIANLTDVGVPLANSVSTASIQAQAVTYAKIQAESAVTILGNPTGAPASPSEITLGAALTFVGQQLRTVAFTGDVTTTANSVATTIAANAVTYAKMQTVTAARLLGNPTGGVAVPSEITLGATLAFVASALQTVALSGDVTSAANSFSTTIAANAVTNAKMATMAASTIKANATGGAATPTDVTLDATLAFSAGVLGEATNGTTNAKLSQAGAFTIKGNNTSGTANVTDFASSQIPGSTTNDSATAGNIGEYISSTITQGSAVALTSPNAANVTSISLTAGDWDVWSNTLFTGGAATTVTSLQSSPTTTSATINSAPGQFGSVGLAGATIFATVDYSLNNGPFRLSLSGTTTVFLVAKAIFAVSTCSAYGLLAARRRR